MVATSNPHGFFLSLIWVCKTLLSNGAVTADLKKRKNLLFAGILRASASSRVQREHQLHTMGE
jgi:hypothetical protein